MSMRTGFKRAAAVIGGPFLVIGALLLLVAWHGGDPSDPYLGDRYGFGMFVLVLGALLYGAIRALGWVVGGFAES